MKILLISLLAAAVLCLPAGAIELPDGLDAVVPQELLEDAMEEGLVARGAAYLWEMLRTSLSDALAASLRGAASLMLLALLCGLIEGTAAEAGESAAQFAPYVGVLGAAALSAGDVSSLMALGLETLDELAVMAKLLMPTVAAAMASSGSVGSASVWQVGALMASDAFLMLIRDVLVPANRCMIGAAAAGALLPQSRLKELADGIKTLITWALSAILAAFVGFLSLSGLLAGSADRVAVRVGKSVISGAVPIVGGILSEATEALLAGAGALRSTLGVLGVFAVLSLCLAPLLRLTVQYLLYRGILLRYGGVRYAAQLSRAALLSLFADAGDDGGRGVFAARLASDRGHYGGDGMTILRSWLLGVVACALLVSACEQLTDGGTMKKIVRFVGGMLLMLALLRPLLRIDLTDLAVNAGAYREAVAQLEEELGAQRQRELSARIAAQTGAYIEDKAASLGASIRAVVTTEERGGVPLPASVTLYGEENAEIGAYIERELGIAKEDQLWITTGESAAGE